MAINERKAAHAAYVAAVKHARSAGRALARNSTATPNATEIMVNRRDSARELRREALACLVATGALWRDWGFGGTAPMGGQ